MAIHFKWFHNITNNLQSLCGWLAGWASIHIFRPNPTSVCSVRSFVRTYVDVNMYIVFVQFFFLFSALFIFELYRIFFSLSVLIAIWAFLARHDSVYRWARTTNCTYYIHSGFEALRIGMRLLFLCFWWCCCCCCWCVKLLIIHFYGIFCFASYDLDIWPI